MLQGPKPLIWFLRLEQAGVFALSLPEPYRIYPILGEIGEIACKQK